MLPEKIDLIGIIGLGYVGLPLAVAFGNKRKTVGYDINKDRITDLQLGIDHTGECTRSQLVESKYLRFTSKASELKHCCVYIITVPTPVNNDNTPDFNPLISASKLVAKYLAPGDIVVYESTVYPGATEEICVPVLEEFSGLKFNDGFYCGYSPERINPGDEQNKLENIVKVTSGSTELVATIVDNLYREIVIAGTHKASSIKVAEASKVIENTQRDVNIAFMNELAMIFNVLGISSEDVFDAASTKWNFQNFRPGLVGGHCIGIDPYYLISKAQKNGFNPEIITASRRVNEGMANFVIDSMLRTMTREYSAVPKKIAILGVTFKENCPDIRNSHSFKLAEISNKLRINVDMFDPHASVDECRERYNYEISNEFIVKSGYDCIIFAVAHDCYKNYDERFFNELKATGVKLIVDVKSIFSGINPLPEGIKIISL